MMMMTMRTFAPLLFLLLTLPATHVAGAATELTLDTFEKEVAGKNGFVKFFAPWCGHCKAMKPAWDELADEYAGSSSVLVADVDCTADGQSLCEKLQVQGYPTIKYFKDGDTTDGEDYQGGRDLDSLKKFVEDELEVKCDVKDPSLCSAKEKAYIEKMKTKSKDERKTQLDRLAKMKGSSMTSDLKRWLNQRLNILKGFAESDEL